MAKKTKQITAPAAVSTVYVGRSLPGLPQYTIFKGGVIPQNVEKMIAEKNAIKHLIVPVNRLAEARRNITIKGHVLYHFAQQI
jgi:hypothetical protein